jgi:hypothetical protein
VLVGELLELPPNSLSSVTKAAHSKYRQIVARVGED